MKKSTRKTIAEETVKIMEQGFYHNIQGDTITIRKEVDLAKSNSIHYTPDMFPQVFRERDKILSKRSDKETTIFEVTNETTLHAAQRLLDEGAANVVCLNFASAKNPGGGFLNGSQAQEESLARATALYPCIAQMKEMYNTNRAYDSCLYTDHMIYSPDVPVFRDDEDKLLNTPYVASFITAPAVNLGALVQQKDKKGIAQAAETMLSRTEKLLSIAVAKEHRTIILGAWGCGVFRNEPIAVAEYFRKHLLDNPALEGAFDKVVFAVLDNSKNDLFIEPFRKVFAVATA